MVEMGTGAFSYDSSRKCSLVVLFVALGNGVAGGAKFYLLEDLLQEVADMMDTQGRYGALGLISTKSGKAVSSFPVDVDVLTFGHDGSCGVRMYFVAVSSLRAKLVFEDSKVCF